MEIRRVEWDDAASVVLRAAQRAEINATYGYESEPGTKPSGDDMAAFFVAFADDGTPLACAGLRPLDDEHAEIKRMFVHPAHRGTGVSSALLARLEGFGLESGWSRLVLETGSLLPGAVRFYTREGYTRIPNYGYYADSADSLCFEKQLVAPDPADDLACEGCQ